MNQQAAPIAKEDEVRVKLNPGDDVAAELVNNLKLKDEKIAARAAEEGGKPPIDAGDGGKPPVVAEENNATVEFQEKFNQISKDGNPEAIAALKDEVSAALKSGKKVDKVVLDQLGISAETPEQKEIADLKVKQELIQNDLKLSKEEKDAALKKLEATPKKKEYWQEDNFMADEETPASKKEEGIPADTTKYQELYEIQKKELDSYKNDEFIKSYRTATASGKNAATFLQELGKNNPSNLSDNQILEGIIKKAELDEDATETQREYYKNMDPVGRRDVIAKERARLNEGYQNSFKQYSVDNKAESDRNTAIAKQGIKEVQELLSKNEGKEVWGIKYDSTQINKLRDWVGNVFANGLYRKDGTFDAPKAMQLGMLALNNKHMLQKAFEKGKFSAEEEGFKTTKRPSNNNGIGASLPDAELITHDENKTEEENEEFMKKNFPPS